MTDTPGKIVPSKICVVTLRLLLGGGCDDALEDVGREEPIDVAWPVKREFLEEDVGGKGATPCEPNGDTTATEVDCPGSIADSVDANDVRPRKEEADIDDRMASPAALSLRSGEDTVSVEAPPLLSTHPSIENCVIEALA